MRYLFLIMAVFSLSGLVAQNTGNVRGVITDQNGDAIEAANIFVQGGNYGAASNKEGEFLIENLSVGSKELVVTAIGYEAQMITVDIQAGETSTQDFIMQTAFSELEEVVVSGDLYSDEFLTNSTTAGTKIPVHPKELPLGMDVLSHYMLTQLQPVRLTDAVQFVSGINQETGFGGRTDIYVIRGFRSDRESIFKNGFRNPMRVYRESSNVQQIEVLKGPASTLFGVSDPGGTVNIVTKKPKSVKHGEVEFLTNQFGMVRPSIDIGGPLNKDFRMNYRLNAAYEQGGTYRDQIHTERFFLAPSISYQINPKTTLTFNGEYLKHSQATDRGVPIYDPQRDKEYKLDRAKSFGDPYNETVNTNSLNQFEIVRKLHGDFSFRSAVNLLSTNGFRNAVEVSGFAAEDSVKRYFQDQRHVERYTAWQNEVLGTFYTGSLKHSAVLGLEYAHTLTDMFIQQDKNYDVVSVFNTKYNQQAPKQLVLATTNDYEYKIDNFGIYFQDFIKVNSYLNLIAGVRYDHYKSVYDNRLKNSVSNNTYTGFSPRVGALVKPLNAFSVFSNYSEGFNPLWGNPADKEGNVFDPIKNSSFDVGVKFYMLNNQFNITATYFDLTRNGLLVDDPDDQDFSIQTGEARSNGFELDIQGEPIPGWTFMTSYSYTDARITEDTNADRVGQPLGNVAPDMFKLWMNYEMQNGALKGFGLGAGHRYISERAASDGIDVKQLDAYNVVDLRLFYRNDAWTSTLSINNLFNEYYFLGSQNYNRAMPGAPRHFTLSFIYKF